MSYQVLARKWRPQSFQEVIGQPHVLTALENGLKQDRVHHAYLFSGTRGVGKTTIARILAKSLNCETGVTATPCGKCANCQDIDQGRFVDLLEIDAASRTKVDDTRELLDNVQYKPAQGRYKVYLIDEVHMLSKHSFNALLKTLEEPPEYVKFLLATTDPQKLPITVLSRCLQFHLKAILPEQIEQQLSAILAHEQATFEQPALRVIAKAADGSMRDALSLTDQALAFGAGNIKYDAVLKMLGTIDQSHLHYLLHFIASGNSQKVFEKIQEFVHLGADFAALHQELASLCHQIALMQLQLNANVSEKTAVQLLAERLTPEEVQLFYQIAVQGFKDYSYAPNGKIALEMTVMRLLAFKPANYIDIDEAMLAETELVEVIEPTVATEQSLPRSTPVSSSALQNEIVEPNAENAHQVPTTPSYAEVNQEQADTEPGQVSHTAPHQEKKLENAMPLHLTERLTEGDTQADVNQRVITETAQAEQVEQTATNKQPETTATEPTTTGSSSFNLTGNTNSRNMLRSHRLKREELKKTKAATGESRDTTEVSKQSAALEIKQPLATEPSTAPQIRDKTEIQQTEVDLEHAVETKFESSKPESPKPVLDNENESLTAELISTTNEQELPPLSSYQDQNEQPDYQGNSQSDNDYFDDYDLGSKHLENNALDIRHAQNASPPPASIVVEKSVVEHQENQKFEPIPTVTKPIQDEVYKSETVASTVVEKEIEPQPKARVQANNDISGLTLTEQNNTQVSFVNDQQYPATEIDVAVYVEDKMTDPWFLDIQAMQLSGFEKLLAKNCVKQQQDNQINLVLNDSQGHLLNNQSLCEGLQNLLRDYYGKQYTVAIEVGKIDGKNTPAELEQIVYQQYLDNAKNAIKNDAIVQIFVRDYAAKVYENSIVPL